MKERLLYVSPQGLSLAVLYLHVSLDYPLIMRTLYIIFSSFFIFLADWNK